MKKNKFIENFNQIATHRLNNELPDETTEGEFIFLAYKIMSESLSHILRIELKTHEEK